MDLTSELENLELLEGHEMLSNSQYTRKGEIQFKLMKIYEEEEKFWFGRSTERWMLQGDLNTSFFYMVANGRRRNCNVFLTGW